jgi:outer membrane protein
MMKIFKRYFFLISLLICEIAQAQELLTLNQALQLALQNNYAILIAKYEADITKNNNTVGGAGMLPNIIGSATQDNQTLNTKQKFLNGAENNRDGANNNSLNANVELGWNIFDGFKMFATKSKLEELQKSGELRMRVQIENTFQRIILSYYDVVLAKQQLNLNKKANELSQKRLQFAEDRFQSGKAAKTELLKAQVDLNTDKSVLFKQENTLKNAKTRLNQLLARELNTPFDVIDSIAYDKVLSLANLLDKAGIQNNNLLIAKNSQRLNLLTLRELKSERLPTIQIRSGYSYNKLESEAGFLQSSQNNGFHYGAALTMNLFNGFDVNRKLQNARLSLKSSELNYKDSINRIQSNIQQTFNNYLTSIELSEFETQNLNIAKQNFEIAEDQYIIGVITALELRDAQQNYYNSEMRLLNALYEIKLNETELFKLTGELFNPDRF